MHGHNSGDYAIKKIADVLVSSVRDEKDVVCRFGGDEFIIVFRKCPPQAAEKAIARMQAKLAQIKSAKETPFDLSFSTGIITIDSDKEESLQDVIERMDSIMYKNKAAYKKARAEAQNM
jgi:diguanylate cyclase (GGDEF)-like protein